MINLRRFAPWIEQREIAKREAQAACAERVLVENRRPLVNRLVYELGLHERENHFVDIVHAVAKGIR